MFERRSGDFHLKRRRGYVHDTDGRQRSSERPSRGYGSIRGMGPPEKTSHSLRHTMGHSLRRRTMDDKEQICHETSHKNHRRKTLLRSLSLIPRVNRNLWGNIKQNDRDSKKFQEKALKLLTEFDSPYNVLTSKCYAFKCGPKLYPGDFKMPFSSAVDMLNHAKRECQDERYIFRENNPQKRRHWQRTRNVHDTTARAAKSCTLSTKNS